MATIENKLSGQGGPQSLKIDLLFNYSNRSTVDHLNSDELWCIVCVYIISVVIMWVVGIVLLVV